MMDTTSIGCRRLSLGAATSGLAVAIVWVAWFARTSASHASATASEEGPTPSFDAGIAACDEASKAKEADAAWAQHATTILAALPDSLARPPTGMIVNRRDLHYCVARASLHEPGPSEEARHSNAWNVPLMGRSN